MRDELSRTAMLLGDDGMQILAKSHVAVFGVGGVGGYVCEALTRSGIGEITIVDNDNVSLSNINRQIIALHSTVGQLKTDVMENRMKDINPDIKVNKFDCFFTAQTCNEIDFSAFDYVVDAIDTVSSKILLVQICAEKNIRIISSMGAGNKLDPTMLECTDIYKTSVCPLARVMRSELRKRGIKKLKVIYSREEVKKPVKTDEKPVAARRSVTASVAFVPSVAGLIAAGEVLGDLIDAEKI